MFAGMEMLGGMFILGRIAASHVTTLQAQAQVNPGVAHLQTFLATFRMRLHWANLAEVRTFWHVHVSFKNAPVMNCA
jgi:hypothetical protein